MLFDKTSNTKFSIATEIFLQIVILISLVAISISTIPTLSPSTIKILNIIEFITLAIFIIEYGLRVWIASPSRSYIFSFWGIIDFMAIVPALVFLGANSQVIRTIRLLRLVRIFKLERRAIELNQNHFH